MNHVKTFPPNSLLMHKGSMLMKQEEQRTGGWVFFFFLFPGCIINRKEKPLCLRSVLESFFPGHEVGPGTFIQG